jgi:hypothetical protein
VRLLSSGDESALTAAAVWSLLQMATDSPADQKVLLHSRNTCDHCMLVAFMTNRS